MAKLDDLEINDEMLLAANRDIVARSHVGNYIYLLIWTAIIIPHDFYSIAPNFTIFFTLTLLTISLIRIIITKKFEIIYAKNPLYWKLCFFPAVWGSALLWGILCYLSFTSPLFESITLVLVISTAGLAGGGVANVVPDRVLTIGLLTAFLLPTEFLIFHPNFHDLTIYFLFPVFWLGMYSITKAQYQEYWRSLKNNFLIKRHALILEQLNTLDGLTGLKNRKYFDESLHREMKNAFRAQSPLSMLLIDIDYFKAINDTYGHLVGDECLRNISILFKEQILRETDIVARYGGEEFAILLPYDVKKQACSLAEKIRKEAEVRNFNNEENEVSFTISIGVATIIPNLNTMDEYLIQAADKALYLAKDTGRNKVIYTEI